LSFFAPSLVKATDFASRIGSKSNRLTSRSIAPTPESPKLKPPGRKQIRKQIIIAFISFHVFVLLLFAFPVDNWLIREMRDLIAPYMRCVGMTDTWDTFAPNPKSAEQYLKAIVITESGEYKLFSFPRMEELPLKDRYRKERYRKFSESILCSECSGLWPDVERAVARRLSDPKDPPVRVILIKYESLIDPKTLSVGDDASAKPTVLSQYLIASEDLN
jgi:hypothetical protein